MIARAVKMAGLSAYVLGPMTPRRVMAEIRVALASWASGGGGERRRRGVGAANYLG